MPDGRVMLRALLPNLQDVGATEIAKALGVGRPGIGSRLVASTRKLSGQDPVSSLGTLPRSPALSWASII